MTDDPRQNIARMIDEGQPVGDDDFDPAEGWGGAEPPAGGPPGDRAEPADLEWCAKLDHSDTDNGKRQMRYFSCNLAVLKQDKASGGARMC